MRTPTAPFALRRARTLDAALKILREEPGTVPIAGCTDVYVALEFGGAPGKQYLDLSRLSGLKRITTSGDKLVIGALATYTELQKSRFVRARLPMLVEAARLVGGVQIQNMGTVGGNLANGSPAGDTLPVFAVAEADVVLAGPEGERRVPFTSFYTGYRASVRKPDELIVAVEVPPVIGKQWFRKVGTRAAQAISKVVFAGVRGLETRLALGSIAPTVVRLPGTERVMNGGGSIDEALAALAGEIRPIDDLRSTAEYRRSVAANLVRQFWSETA
jgi:CO/xanthine dehydrogenase FAD-binding subunit